jgi:two-component system LytT family sensor kinase
MQQHWFFRYKIYHIPFWMLYNYLLWAIAIDSVSNAASSIFLTPFFFKFFFYVLFPALAVYFNLYFLIPRYLEKKKYVTYIILLLLTILAASALITPGYYISPWLVGKTAREVYGIEDGFRSWYQLFKESPLKSTLGVTTLAMSIKLTKNWIAAQQRQQVLEREKLETELALLKYQFNPHFLFNSINSVFFLIHQDPDQASEALARFSGLLSYQLYECEEPQISLEKEITYLQHFVELEKLRQNKLEVVWDVQYEQGLAISPFILMTFVENAFKHVSKHSPGSNKIIIRLRTVGQQLEFYVANTCGEKKETQVIRYQGIGLKNVRRRLELLYPGDHRLSIQNENVFFEIQLSLQLNEYAFKPPVTEHETAMYDR